MLEQTWKRCLYYWYGVMWTRALFINAWKVTPPPPPHNHSGLERKKEAPLLAAVTFSPAALDEKKKERRRSPNQTQPVRTPRDQQHVEPRCTCAVEQDSGTSLSPLWTITALLMCIFAPFLMQHCRRLCVRYWQVGSGQCFGDTVECDETW